MPLPPAPHQSLAVVLHPVLYAMGGLRYNAPIQYSWVHLVSHTIVGKTKLLARVKRIGGQVQALQRALEAERGCAEVLQQLAAVRGAVNGLMVEVMEEHIENHLANPLTASKAKRRQGKDELMGVVRTYLK